MTGNSNVTRTSSMTSGSTATTVEPSYLLYLYPSDSPGIVIVDTTFNGLGYES